ncbi:methyl-accepting chemotaxis protein [Paenibacillus sambharensis]|uniref:Methyl-accepting chemotaxis protein n=1 Tax=Paenibacillus sambharensis TaxID=1803190 RepID=A0A2W1LBV2_9BACL|nr:methyl-accepting chemotaxis protein [Paenibacillus sambharensis]PZD97698.1 methyl-accepting chemotaxis protein [Paenibacillus sambharensis]
MLARLGLTFKLIMLLAIPVVLLSSAAFYGLSKTGQVTDLLIENLYTASYRSNDSLINADRDLYQAMTAVKTMEAAQRGSEIYPKELESFRENVEQASQRMNAAWDIWKNHKSDLLTADTRQAMDAYFEASLLKLQEWELASQPLLAELPDAAGSKKRELVGQLDGLDSLFEESRGNIDELADLIQDNIETTVAAMREEVERMLTVFAVAAGIAIAVSAAACWLLIHNIRRSIRSVVRSADAVAAGNLAAEPVQVKSRDEIGALGTAVNRMTDSLKLLISSVSEVSLTVAASSEQLAASAEQTGHATEHIAGRIQLMAEGAQDTADQARQSDERIRSMVAGAKAMDSRLMQVADTARQAAAQSGEGSRVVEQAVSSMDNIDRAVTELSDSIVKLGHASQEISSFIGAITGIANQTNMLALNAGIEAARAGEQGRGFSVVAAEIRKLAEQTSSAAKQAAELTDNITNSSRFAVEGMEVAGQEVTKGKQSIEQADQAFAGIQTAVGSLASQIAVVSGETRKLADSAEMTGEIFSRVADVAIRSSDDTQEVSAATEQQLASMEDVASSSRALSAMAEQLQELIAKFRT